MVAWLAVPGCGDGRRSVASTTHYWTRPALVELAGGGGAMGLVQDGDSFGAEAVGELAWRGGCGASSARGRDVSKLGDRGFF